jgi:WD40 repeat protein
VCKHLVCDACAKDWSTCAEPWGRVFRIGTTGRLVEVDPSGQFGLVSRWIGAMRLIELRTLRWVSRVELPSFGLGWGELRPVLTSTCQFVTPLYSAAAGDEYRVFDGIQLRSLLGQSSWTVRVTEAPVRSAGVTATGDHYWYVNNTETVTVIAPDDRARRDGGAPYTSRTYEPLPRKVLQQVYVDASLDLLVSATWGEIALHRMDGDRLVLLGHVKTTGNASWLALGGRYLAAGVPSGVKVWRLAQDLSIGGVVLSIDRNVQKAALSRDGRYLAIGVEDDAIMVHDVDTGTVETFDEHTDRIGLIRFVGDDQLLVTADCDNRVIVRPRTPTGYARPLMPVTLAQT